MFLLQSPDKKGEGNAAFRVGEVYQLAGFKGTLMAGYEGGFLGRLQSSKEKRKGSRDTSRLNTSSRFGERSGISPLPSLTAPGTAHFPGPKQTVSGTLGTAFGVTAHSSNPPYRKPGRGVRQKPPAEG